MATNYLDIVARLRDGVSGGLARIAGSVRGLMNSMERLNRLQNRMNVLVAQGAQMRDRARAFLGQDVQAIHRQNAALERQNRIRRRSGYSWTPVQQSLAALGGYGYALGRGGPATLVGVGGAVAGYQALKQHAQLEDRLADIRKVIDTPANPVSKAEMSRYGNVSRQLSTKYGIPAVDVATSMFRMAQTGISGFDNLTTLADLVSKINITWDDVDPEKISATLGRMGNTFFKNEMVNNPELFRQKMQRAADAINSLEASFPSTGAEIVEAMMRGQPQAEKFGLTAEQTAAIFSAQISAGEPSGERVGTRSRIMFQRLTSMGATDRAKRIEVLDELLGWTPEKWDAERSKDPLGTFLKFSEALENLPDAKRLAMLGKLFGEEAGATSDTLFGGFANALAQLATADDATAKLVAENEKYLNILKKTNPELAKFIEKNKVAPSGGSIDKELGIKLNTLAKSADKAWESVKNLMSGFGESNAGPFKAWLDELSAYLAKLEEVRGISRADQAIENERKAEKREAPIGGERANSTLVPFIPKTGGFTDPIPQPSWSPYGPSGAGMGNPKGEGRSGPIHQTSRHKERYWDDGEEGQDAKGRFVWEPEPGTEKSIGQRIWEAVTGGEPEKPAPKPAPKNFGQRLYEATQGDKPATGISRFAAPQIVPGPKEPRPEGAPATPEAPRPQVGTVQPDRTRPGYRKVYPPELQAPSIADDIKRAEEAAAPAIGATISKIYSAFNEAAIRALAQITGPQPPLNIGGYGAEEGRGPILGPQTQMGPLPLRVPWPEITVVPPAPMSIPITLEPKVTKSGTVNVHVSVDNAGVTITSQGAMINSGAQADPGVTGTATK
jgi:TP901 family phage tail tape measure protein